MPDRANIITVHTYSHLFDRMQSSVSVRDPIHECNGAQESRLVTNAPDPRTVRLNWVGSGKRPTIQGMERNIFWLSFRVLGTAADFVLPLLSALHATFPINSSSSSL